jgi:hypothetical protein
MARDITTTPEFLRGRTGELLVGRELMARGFHVIPSYDYHGGDDHPPRMEGPAGAYVLPDLDVARDGVRVWVEIKVKAEPTFHRKTGRWEHGFCRRLWGHYREVEAITGSRVFLFIIEESSGEVLVASLRALDRVKRVYAGPAMGPYGMVFFPRAAFRVL